MNPRILSIAAAMAFIEGYFNSHTLAFTNNNPGNITRWGTTPMNGRFCHFPSKVSGFEALYDDINANQKSLLRDFIAKYAPPNENSTSIYLEDVCLYTGIGPDEVIEG
jgi:hypothetical protein